MPDVVPLITWQGWQTFIAATATPHVAVLSIKGEGGFYGDVTGCLGYAMGNTLLYAKGGFAWFEPNYSASASIDVSPIQSRSILMRV